ncbi:hypothetical protein ACUN24_24020 [Pedobacter sp. WC2501]|uniref:hypothetical protein n=1 Tax=Pedobacter sp. WC2501 TaxID=3461400 RepID=UPI00404573DC
MLRNYDTKHNYNFSNKVYDKLISLGKIKAGENIYTMADEVHLELVDAEAKKAGIYQNRQLAMLAYRDENIEKQWQNRSNADNFGPVLGSKRQFFRAWG